MSLVLRKDFMVSLTDWLTLLSATSVVLVVGELARFLRRPSAA